MEKNNFKKYTVIQDIQEKIPWQFLQSVYCAGTEVKHLETADYSLKGLEKKFVIERKRDTGEFARNITQKRFERELIRLQEFEFPFLILEFTMSDILNFPHGSGIPEKFWKRLQINSSFMLQTLIDYQIKYRAKIILAGKHGKSTASYLFKRMVEIHDSEFSAGEETSTGPAGICLA
jgi:hypothetical protein